MLGLGQAIARLGSARLVLNKPFGSARLVNSEFETVARVARAARRAKLS